MAQSADREFYRVKVTGVRPKAQNSAGIALPTAINYLQVGGFITAGKNNLMNTATTLNNHIHLGRQGVDHRHTNTVQTAGELIVVIGEFATGMQGRENHFDAG